MQKVLGGAMQREVAPYARAMRCPVLIYVMTLPDGAEGSVGRGRRRSRGLCMQYAMCGTATGSSVGYVQYRYAVFGTRCPGLTQGLPGEREEKERREAASGGEGRHLPRRVVCDARY
eukprot:3309649-Rhodomonas_salina.3